MDGQQRFPRPDANYRAQTVGPDPDDWAVVDEQGEVVWRGPAILAARAAAELRRLATRD